MAEPSRVIVTGATGFIGSHVIEAALAQGLMVTAVGRDRSKALSSSWLNSVRFVTADLHSATFDPRDLGAADAMIHLAWPGLPDYRDTAHLERHLPDDMRFIEKMLATGVRKLVITGTCLEYGIKYGPLPESTPTSPELPYAIAKDKLRTWIHDLTPSGVTVIWARLFYMYGPGQSSRSILQQLDSAIKRGDSKFPMSPGEQLRDYLPVEEVARRLVRLIGGRGPAGVYNICSGVPISIRRLVEQRISKQGASIELELGSLPYPDYEPVAFWGDGSKFEREFGASDE